MNQSDNDAARITWDCAFEIAALPEPGQLVLPGGVAIEHVRLADIAQPALSPLVPLFDVVDAVVAVHRCVQAIPDALGPPPDPTVIAACLPELGQKVSRLLQLVPQLSLPVTIVGLIDLVVDTLREARGELLYLADQVVLMTATADRASQLDDLALADIAACGQRNIEREAANIGARIASLGRLFGLLQRFLSMIGGPDVPDLSSLSGLPLDRVIEPLDELIAALEGVRAAVPVP